MPLMSCWTKYSMRPPPFSNPVKFLTGGSRSGNVAGPPAQRRRHASGFRRIGQRAGVNAAFGFAKAAPAAAAQVAVRRRPVGAWHAADRAEPQPLQWMARQFCRRKHRVDLAARQWRERIEFLLRYGCVDHRQRRAFTAVIALSPADPAVEGH